MPRPADRSRCRMSLSIAHLVNLQAHPRPRPLVAFDLDGTLIDSRLDLAHAVNAMLHALGRPELSLKQVIGYVGEGAATLVRRALAQGEPESPALFEQAIALFLDHYQAHLLDHTCLYPGVHELLQVAHHRAHCVLLSNKPEAMCRAILGGLGVAGLFDSICGGDTFAARKPDPLGLQTLIGRWQTAARYSLIVGDSGIDIRTGRAAGAWTCGVTYGFAPADFTLVPPDWRVDSAAAVAALLQEDWHGD